MAKLYEVMTTLDWELLSDLAGESLVGSYELFNAGRSGGATILFTESAEKPTDESFYKTLKRQAEAILTVGRQPIWVKSEVSPAKLIVSAPNGDSTQQQVIAFEGNDPTATMYLQLLDGTIYKWHLSQRYIADAGTAWADRATANYVLQGE